MPGVADGRGPDGVTWSMGVGAGAALAAGAEAGRGANASGDDPSSLSSSSTGRRALEAGPPCSPTPMVSRRCVRRAVPGWCVRILVCPSCSEQAKATDRQHGEAASDKRGGKNGTDKIRALKSYGNANTFFYFSTTPKKT